MKKKLIAMFMSVAMLASLTACAGAAPAATSDAAPAAEASTDGGSEAAEAEAEAATDMKVAMVTDYGDITDQSFNQSTYEACKAFCEANGIDFTYYKPEGDSTADRVAMIDKAVADGYNVVVMPGYAFAEAIVESAPTYPDVKFVALDVSEFDLTSAAGTDTYDEPNVFSAIYQEELAGYMGLYQARFLRRNGSSRGYPLWLWLRTGC